MRPRARSRTRTPIEAPPLPPEPQPLGEPGLSTRDDTSIAFDPFALGPYGQELLKRRVVFSPVLVAWTYRVVDAQRFGGWLATREILLAESRMSGDPELAGIRYGGTYAIASAADDPDQGAAFRTLWGYDHEAAMQTMHRLCGDPNATATLVQLELIDFVKGVKRFVAEAGDHHFAQEVLVVPSAGRA